MAKQSALLRPFSSLAGLTTTAYELRREESSPFAPLELPSLKSIFNKGLQPGTIIQIEGRRSSGRAALGAYMLAEATGRGEICAIVDTQDNLHPESLEAAGVRLNHVVWVRCNGNPDHAFRSVDLLLHAGGFGLVWLDLCEVPARALNKVPLSYWHRFRRAIENTPSVLLVCGDFACAKASLSHNLQVQMQAIDWLGGFGLVESVQISATVQKNAATHPLLLPAVI